MVPFVFSWWKISVTGLDLRSYCCLQFYFPINFNIFKNVKKCSEAGLFYCIAVEGERYAFETEEHLQNVADGNRVTVTMVLM